MQEDTTREGLAHDYAPRRCELCQFSRRRTRCQPEHYEFWLRELRTPDFLLDCVRRVPEIAREVAGTRPVTAAAVTDDLKYVSANVRDLPRLLLETGDILFNRTNSFELVGKTGTFRGSIGPFTFASYLIRLRTCPGVLPEYTNLVPNSPFFRTTQIRA